MEAVGFLLVVGAMAIARSWLLFTLNRPGWPWGTLGVNVLGSFVAGVAVAHAPASWSTAVGIAALGAFTTFSTFAVEIVALWSGRRLNAVLYAVLTSSAAVGAAAVGLGT